MSDLFSKIPFRRHEEIPQEGHQHEAAHVEEDGDSLTTILPTAEHRSALTILLAECTESMRQMIVDAFDAKQTGKKSDLVADVKDAEALNNTGSKSEQDSASERAKQKKELEQREKELGSAKLQELKNAALQHFEDWRSNVLQRVGEVVNSKETGQQQEESAKPKQEKSPERAVSPPMKFPTPSDYDPSVDREMRTLYSPIKNELTSLPEQKRALIMHSVLLLLLSLEHYQSYSRVLLLHLTTSLNLSISYLARDESKVARGLLTAAENLKADEEMKKKTEENKDNRKWKVGLATVAGAALIGVTGGLAAPLLAAGVGTMMGGLGLGATAAAGYLGTLAGSSVLVGGLFGAYGGRMTGKMMDQYAREVEDFAFVQVKSYHKPRKIEKEFRRLRVAIGISGWLTHPDEVVEPWKVIGVEMESFALRWELEALMGLGNSLNTMVKSAAWSLAKKEIIKHTVFAALAAGLWPLALVKVSRIIENPWSVASHRAQKAGEVLADALINKAQGERPVTLIGYSLGAKAIYTCLQRLAERKAFGLVESAIFIGSPTPSDSADWRLIRTVVAGRVVNVYSTKDYILGFLYRSSSVQYGVAGLQPIENVKGVENVDVSDMVSGHTMYRFLTGTILSKIGFEDVDAAELAKQQKEEKEEELKEEAEREESEKKEGSAVETDGDVSDQHVRDLEKEVEDKNQQSYIGWAQEKMTLAGTSASVAYENAKLQWKLKRKAGDGADAAVAKQSDGFL